MQCFIDFDDTLFNSKQLKEDLFSQFSFLSSDEMWKAYSEFRSQHTFSLCQFADFLKTKNVEPSETIIYFKTILQDTKKYVAHDAQKFLDALKTLGLEIFLLSVDADIEEWQKPKVEGSGLTKNFEKIYLIDYKKIDHLSSLGVDDRFIFIDDKPSEIKAMRDAFPKALCLLHPLGSNLDQHIPAIESYLQC